MAIPRQAFKVPASSFTLLVRYNQIVARSVGSKTLFKDVHRAFSSGLNKASVFESVDGNKTRNTGQVSSADNVKRSESHFLDLKRLPFKISRQVDGPIRIPDATLTLFQYQNCPFCCKVRTFLDYYGITYNVVEVNPVFRQQIKFSKYRKVPFLIISRDGLRDYVQLNDSSFIVSLFHTYLHAGQSTSLEHVVNTYQEKVSGQVKGDDAQSSGPHSKYTLLKPTGEPVGLMSDNSELKWRIWADDVLVHTLSPNIYRTYGEAVKSFQHFSSVANWEQHFPLLQRYVVIYFGALAMKFVGTKLKNKYKLNDNVRLSLYEACNTWLDAVGPSGPFHGGLKPNLADLAVFGLLSSIEGTNAFEDVIRNTDIGVWFQLLKLECKRHSGAALLNAN